MARGLNRVMLIGNLGDEPQIKQTPNGTQIATLSIVTNEAKKGADGTWQEFAEWHRVTLWDRLATVAQNFLHKGSQVYIEGKLRTHSYEDSKYTNAQGMPLKRYVTDIVATELQMLGKKSDNQGGGGRPGAGYGAPPAPAPGTYVTAGAPAPQYGGGGYGAPAPAAGQGAPRPGPAPAAGQGQNYDPNEIPF